MGRYSELVDGNNLKFMPPEEIPTALKIITDFYAANPETSFPVNGSQAEKDAFMRKRLTALKSTQGKLITAIRTEKNITWAKTKNVGMYFGFTSFEQNQAEVSARNEAILNLDKGIQTFFYSQLTVADQNVMIEYALRLDRGGNDDDAFISHQAVKFAGYVAGAAILATVGAGAVTTLAGSVAATSTGSGAAIEGGSLAGASGLLGETITVTGFAETGAAATTAVEAGGLFSGLGNLSGVLSGAEASLGAAVLNEGKKYVEGLLQPKKEVAVQSVQQASQPKPQQALSPLILGAGFLAILYYLI